MVRVGVSRTREEEGASEKEGRGLREEQDHANVLEHVVNSHVAGLHTFDGEGAEVDRII